jgi:hypothetical protein
VLLDRAFFTVDVIKALKRLRLHFIIPAVKNDKVKQAISNYDKDEPAKRFILGDRRSNVCFNLAVYQRPKEHLPQKKKLGVYDLYFGFATNLSITGFWVSLFYSSRVQAPLGHRNWLSGAGKRRG